MHDGSGSKYDRENISPKSQYSPDNPSPKKPAWNGFATQRIIYTEFDLGSEVSLSPRKLPKSPNIRDRSEEKAKRIR